MCVLYALSSGLKLMFGCNISINLYKTLLFMVFFLADIVPTLTPTEASHRYGDLPSADPLTTENSAYGIGEEMATTDN